MKTILTVLFVSVSLIACSASTVRPVKQAGNACSTSEDCIEGENCWRHYHNVVYSGSRQPASFQMHYGYCVKN